MSPRMPCSITDGPASEMDAHDAGVPPAEPDADDYWREIEDALGYSHTLWSRNLLAMASWRERMRAGAVEPDLRNYDQLWLWVYLSSRLHKQKLKLWRGR